MESEDGPNFSYAYGGASAPSSAPSWNPALRPDNAPEHADAPSLRELQPSPQIVPQSKPVLDSSQDDDDDLPPIPEPSAIPLPVSNGIFRHDAGADDGFFSRNDSGSAPKTGETNGSGVSGADGNPLVTTKEESSSEEESSHEEEDEEGEDDEGDEEEDEDEDDNDDDDDEDEEDEEDEGDEKVSISNADTLQSPAKVHAHQATAEVAEAAKEHPEQHYEHQGETLLEAAVADSENVPLVADSAAPADDDWGASDGAFDLGGEPQASSVETPLDTPLQPPQAPTGGTTAGDEVIGTSKVGGNADEDIDWGNADGQDFFGQVTATQTVEPQQPVDQSPGAHIVQESEPKLPADPTWDLELDDDLLDDDFLPDTEAPAFELDDDEGFLEDEQPTQPTSSGISTANRYAPQTAQAPQPATTPYGVVSPQVANFSQVDPRKPVATAPIAYGAYNQPARPSMSSSAQSFADKAKGGYHSPYDLPEDIVTTRKRPAPRTSVGPTAVQPTPPPRSSSIPNIAADVPRPLPPSNMSAASLSPPSSVHSMQPHMTGLQPNAPPKLASKTSSSDFFAELPVTSKPKPPGRYTPTPQQTPAQQLQAHPPQLPLKDRTPSWSSLRNQVLPESDPLISQLQQPDRLPVFPDQPSAPVRANSLPVPQQAPAPSARYSPAPPPSAPAANTRFSPVPPPVPGANNRYSPAPQGSAQARHVSEPPSASHRPPVQPYAPRTSSPLAFHASSQDHQVPQQNASHPPLQHALHSAEGVPRASFKSPLGSLEGVSEVEEQGLPQASALPPRTAGSATPPPPRSSPSSTVGSPRKKNYTPQYQPSHAANSTTAVPPRASSQSPTATMKQAHRSVSSTDRPTSGHGLMSPTSNFGIQPAVQSAAIPNLNTIPHRRQVSNNYECIAPTDERASDPLERWKGSPIFTWGLGGTLVTTFPVQIPRYGGGATAPMLKCSPGEVKIQNVKEAFPLSDEIARFPGPLKKSKKKEVSLWLGRRITALESQLHTPGLEQSTGVHEIKRIEEKALLWKILQVLVDHDGHLEGNPSAEAAVKKVLYPGGEDSFSNPDGTFSTAADLVSITRSDTAAIQAESIDPRAVDELRGFLTNGEREKAVWHAVDRRLWGHAMLLSSTLGKDVWRQVVQEFVRKEVKKVGRGNQALAVLYEVFAGNHEDCIDELVPASARAGFQMVSTDGAGSAQNALQGLDKWRETLALVLNNRSENDASALLSLGRLLASYGRVEAAHICFIFGRSVAHIGGVDDTQSDIVLLGADHRQSPSEVGNDPEPILLTEVYEFALSLSAQNGSHIIPHLQNYKLVHAYQLAEYGYRTDAQAYCDAIATTMKSTTRVSPYYNASFIASLDDLSKRLSQSPKDGSSSWISKPSMDKVSSSLLSKFNSFIAGDDDDKATNTPGGGDVGPFANISGNSPTTNLSPSQSSADLYGTMTGYGASAPPASAPTNSRYAPSNASNAYAPRASLDQNRPRYEPQGRPSLESSDGTAGMRAVSDSYLPSPQASGPYTPSQSQFSPPGKSQSYSPLKADAPTPLYGSPYQPTAPADEPSPAFGGYLPTQASFDDPAQSSAGYEPPSSSFEPPSGGYEPPAYQPYNPDEPDSPVETKPKKKSFMDDDDDDDISTRAAALKSKGKSDADRQADDAFRKAAEADAQRDKDAAAKKGGWFGGWFGKKDPNAQQSGPIKAKLGEENSFYYDPDLKKWINKKAGSATEATRPIATPPPPRAPPSRTASSGSMGPPSSLPGANTLGAPPSLHPTSNPQRSSSMPPPLASPGSRASTPGIPSDSEGKPPVLMRPTLNLSGSGPPSRPSTGMSNASSIEDLIGAPQARKGAAGKKKKGGRYVDVMAK